jgi:hypothetical protein
MGDFEQEVRAADSILAELSTPLAVLLRHPALTQRVGDAPKLALNFARRLLGAALDAERRGVTDSKPLYASFFVNALVLALALKEFTLAEQLAGLVLSPTVEINSLAGSSYGEVDDLQARMIASTILDNSETFNEAWKGWRESVLGLPFLAEYFVYPQAMKAILERDPAGLTELLGLATEKFEARAKDRRFKGDLSITDKALYSVDVVAVGLRNLARQKVIPLIFSSDLVPN